MAKVAISDLATIVGHAFARPELLQTAITHPSATGRGRVKRTRRSSKASAAEAKQSDNQRLEFLGDRVLGLIVAEMLFATFPDEDEGALAKRLAALVRQDGLAQVAHGLGFGKYLVLSKGEEESGGRDNPATLADACEAIIGALYLDGGIDCARAFIERHWQPMMSAELNPPQDAKTALQEWAQAAGLNLPRYTVIRSEGPPHDPVFEVEAGVDGYPPSRGTGRSKRAAEQAAATQLLALVRPLALVQDKGIEVGPL
ncbi:ribonuclease III [Dongia mobilis]|uniref:ribonuclease III n=1 Tax=Dongia sp. TaxID=1977262 RepID=UPI0026ECAB5A